MIRKIVQLCLLKVNSQAFNQNNFNCKILKHLLVGSCDYKIITVY